MRLGGRNVAASRRTLGVFADSRKGFMNPFSLEADLWCLAFREWAHHLLLWLGNDMHMPIMP